MENGWVVAVEFAMAGSFAVDVYVSSVGARVVVSRMSSIVPLPEHPENRIDGTVTRARASSCFDIY